MNIAIYRERFDHKEMTHETLINQLNLAFAKKNAGYNECIC